MAQILQKRIPNKTVKSHQQKAMRAWSATIVETYSNKHSVPIVDASKYKSGNGGYLIYSKEKK